MFKNVKATNSDQGSGASLLVALMYSQVLQTSQQDEAMIVGSHGVMVSSNTK